MSSDRITAYAQAFAAVTAAGVEPSETEDELFRFARVFEGNDELRTTLSDPQIPAARRQQIVEDILGSATPETTSLLSMIVGLDRASDIPVIVDQTVALRAQSRTAEVAEVRSAVPLDDDQKARLAVALESATGRKVEVRVVIDESVLGGVVTTIGDTVIDGSIRSRLTKLRDAF